MFLYVLTHLDWLIKIAFHRQQVTVVFQIIQPNYSSIIKVFNKCLFLTTYSQNNSYADFCFLKYQVSQYKPLYFACYFEANMS